MGEFINFLTNNLADFWTYTGFANATTGHLIMILVGLFFIYLAVAKEFEPMLLIPIGFGILIGNIPFNTEAGLNVGIYEEGSVLNILYQGVMMMKRVKRLHCGRLLMEKIHKWQNGMKPTQKTDMETI